MSDEKTEELKRNILSPSAWVRILFMIFYAVMCWLLTIVMSVIVVAQVLISLITGRDNKNLQTVGTKAADYFRDMLYFLVYATEDKPWPFTDESGFVASNNDLNGAAGTEDSAAADQAAQQPPEEEKSASGDDVFADISFTDNEEDVTPAPSNDSPDITEESDEDRDKT